MKHCLVLLATLVLAVGCKTDSESAKSGSAAPQAEQSANSGRSGKIDLPQRRRPAGAEDGARPELPDRPQLTDEERRARREERRQERMAELDKNGDGKIEESERLAARKERMDEMRSRMDANGDGKLTVDELQSSRESVRLGEPAAGAPETNCEI